VTTATKPAARLKAKPPEEVKPGPIKGNLFGPSGAGKTWFALSFPTPYYIDAEGGADLGHYMKRLSAAGGSYLGADDGACDFEVILEQIQALATTQHTYKTLVIDSITKVYQTAIAREAERLGDKDAFGASKKPAIAHMRRLVSWINRLPMNVWFIAHESTEWGQVGGQRQEIGKTADVWDKLIYELDLTLRIKRHSKMLRTATVTKSRLMGFPELERFEIMREGVDVSYAEFASRYGRDFLEAAATPIVLATAEQVSRIRSLLDAMRISDEDVSKALAKANVETIEDLTTEQAAKFEAALRARIEVKS